MNDLRQGIMDILKVEGTMAWGDLVDRFPEDAIDSDLPAAISYLNENGYISMEDVDDDREWLVSFKKDL